MRQPLSSQGRQDWPRGVSLRGRFVVCARFKDKFDPRWEPRYIVAPGAWTLPIVLAEVALLTNGPRAPAAQAGGAS